MKTPTEIQRMLLACKSSMNSPNHIDRVLAEECVKLLNWVLEPEASDPIVNSMIEDVILRSRGGIKEYGFTLLDNPAATKEWLEHLQSELTDAALYIERLKQDL